MLSKAVTSHILKKSSNQLFITRAASISNWGKLEAAPADPILGLSEAFKKDPNPKKQLLGAGVYRDNDNKPYVLNCIRAAEKVIV